MATSNRARLALTLAAAAALIAGCTLTAGGGAPSAGAGEASAGKGKADPMYRIAREDTAGLAKAVFAGGCFWCVETAYEGVEGVKAAISGYVGGQEADPTYDDVGYGRTGHAEAVLVSFDPSIVSYRRLLEIFWVNHDPTTGDRQFCDRGRQYRPGVFYLDDEQKALAEASVAWAKQHARFEQPIVTEITRAGPFWPAEEYHQDFYKKNPVRYQTYRIGCRRDARLKELWGDLAKAH